MANMNRLFFQPHQSGQSKVDAAVQVRSFTHEIPKLIIELRRCAI